MKFYKFWNILLYFSKKDKYPSLPPVTISGAPYPIFNPPIPSTQLTISLWALTVQAN